MTNEDQESRDIGLSSLGSISEGAGLFLFGTGISRGIGFIINVILTRSLGASLYGMYAYVNVLLSLFQISAKLGGDKSVLRYIPAYEDNDRMQHIMLTLAYGTSLVAGTAVAAAMYYFAPVISRYTLSDPLFVSVVRIAAIVVPFNSFAQITYSAFKSIDRMDYNVATSSIAQPTLRLIFISGAILLGYSVVGATAALVVSSLLVSLIAIVVLSKRTNLGEVNRPTRENAREYYNFSVPLMFNQAGNFLYNRVDILIVGFLLTGSAVGIYNIAVAVSSFLILPLSAFNQIFTPTASRLYHEGNLQELESVYRTVTRWSFTLSLFPAIATVLYAGDILQIFGEGFTEGKVVLSLFVFAQLTNSLVGPSGLLLMMSDHQYLTLANQLSSGITNAILNYVLIIEYGFIGAALATASVLAGINVLRVIEVWYLEGISPYSRKYSKPIAAGAFSGLMMYGFSLILEDYMLVLIGSVVGAGCFAISLYILGIEKEEAKLAKGAYSKAANKML